MKFIKGFFTLGNILKCLGAIGILIPLITASFDYKQSIARSYDNDFHDIVDKFSSQKREDRIAGATNLGLFVGKPNKFREDAIDILINDISVEHDIGVLIAINSSLSKVKKEEYKDTIQKLLNLDREAFVYKTPLVVLLEMKQTELKITRSIMSSKNNSLANKVVFDKLTADVDRIWKSINNTKEEINELEEQKVIVATFIALFLDGTRKEPVEGLVFYKNQINRTVLPDLQLEKSTIKDSSFSSSKFQRTDFSYSTICNTLFSNSSFEKCNFSNCSIASVLFDEVSSLNEVDFRNTTFTDVFFTGADLTDADFTSAKGLNPVYFFKAKNSKLAKFDSEFKKELDAMNNKNQKDAESEFKTYIDKSKLNVQRRKEIWVSYSEITAMEKS